ncbi:MBL fold metallo-hydrolase [Streptococcus ferus]|uniref:Hydrolase n=1 Tax=Streptococcus ferus TaxID=1345 RepID=A0A2X3Y095_9STRE|nr:MBL fold metallo-hydrolase [Streptococcus ferus]SQF40172.1 hydrolase [Streptococcus ferus]
MKKLKKHWKKILLGLSSLLIIVAGLGYWQIRRMGQVTVPEFVEIADNTYAIAEGMNQSGIYLLVGEEDAILIDTGNGLSDLPAGIKEITDLPVTVINTHGHYDHTRGNHYFETVYQSEKDAQVYAEYNTVEKVKEKMDEISPLIQLLLSAENETIYNTPIKEDVLALPESGSFDFAGRNLEIIELPGHTPGSIGLIDDATKSVFVGDALTKGGFLLGLEESLSPETQKETLLKLKELFESGRVTAAYGGHVNTAMTLEDVEKGLTIVNKIIDGDLTDEEKESGRISYQGMEVTFKTE